MYRVRLPAAGARPHPPTLLPGLQEGGGRKGLPKSFLNRFSRVHVELLQQTDLLFIAGTRAGLVRRTFCWPDMSSFESSGCLPSPLPCSACSMP